LKKHKALGLLSVLAACFALPGCATVSSQALDHDGATELQREARQIARGRGFGSLRGLATGRLFSRQTGGLRVNLKAGESYLAIGLCDENCTDLDLAIYDVHGVEIASDTLEDAIPIIEFAPKKTGDFMLRTRLIRCDFEPCVYVTGTFGK